jgi:isopenicillin N synthase-like dioxygenase
MERGSPHIAACLPVIDIGPLVACASHQDAVAEAIGRACREVGFFYIVNHGVDETLQQRLELLSRSFFAKPLEEKLRIRMALGGRAWRGYFPVGDELTSGYPDRKEGLYFGAELTEQDARVRAGLPLHGRNLFPADPPELRETVLAYMDAMTQLGHRLMAGISQSLGLAPNDFADRYTHDPMILFRIFNYPAELSPDAGDASLGVGEHTDYGVLTILKQDDAGGLQVKTRSRWVEATPIPGSFVCNIGDMLDRMTGGRYRSTPHCVRNRSGRDRISFPFFFDPSWDAEVKPIAVGSPAPDDRHERWDRASVHDFQGTYGDYLLRKVSKVFPALQRDVLK